MSGGGAILARVSSIESNATDYLEIGQFEQLNNRNSIATGIILSCSILLIALIVSPLTAFLAVAIAISSFGHILTASQAVGEWGTLSRTVICRAKSRKII